ncbi:MAG: DeoR/GlpR transcriptional regulator [Clostridia bacterium]|nr:DeoR/GlpR transcriptional regulator [Clostridia bacterium]
MFANERQEKIYELLQKNGAVTTSGLVETFKVSIETVRRDLLNMELEGRLTRVHGGAVAKNDMKPFFNLEKRNTEFEAEKEELSIKAMEFINEGDIIGIDSGSTAIIFSKLLRTKFSKLTVVTHSLDVFNLLCCHKEFSVILCSGQFLKGENAFYGALTLDALSTLHIQKSFIFPSAVSLENGICDYQSELYQIQREYFKHSDEIFVLADSSKFQKNAMLKVSDMSKAHIYITDSKLPQELVSVYKENDIIIYKGDNQNG